MSLPNPGSVEAKQVGCLCPVLDNNHGKWAPFPPGTAWGGEEGNWWVREDCPVHGPSGE